jgi:hypothetical protein
VLKNFSSKLCTYSDFKYDWFNNIELQIYQNNRIRRKRWEIVSCVNFLQSNNKLKEGSKGLVFAVGTERLPSYFASFGCNILATDYINSKFASKWNKSNQLCLSKEQLYYPELVDRDTFDKNISFKNVDMNNIPEELFGKFDFCWSCCALEHIGGLQKGSDFILNSIKCLKPGGLFFHTTEFNCSSNDKTVDQEENCFFRKRDVNSIVNRIRLNNHLICDVDYSIGDSINDKIISMPPEYKDPHLKLKMAGHVVTSISLLGAR